MATDFVIPTNAELNEVAQQLLPRLQADRPVFGIFPIRNHESLNVMWEQEDRYTGLSQVRGLNGAPSRISKTAVNRFLAAPGIYGEFDQLDERDLLERRSYGTFGQPVELADLFMRSQKKLLVRRLDRIEWIIWTLLATGTFSVPGEAGAVIHTDSYTTQTFHTVVPWGTVATATPLADLRAVQLKHRGFSVRFDQSASAFMNRKTANKMLSNTNAADLYGRRVAGLATANSVEMVNSLFTMDGLPNVSVYDEGYLDESSDFHPFVPDDVVVVVGRRTDASPIGEFMMTKNVNNPGNAPGPYMRVIDRGEQHIPRTIEVHDGFNGGPAIFFPSAVVLMDVSHTGA